MFDNNIDKKMIIILQNITNKLIPRHHIARIRSDLTDMIALILLDIILIFRKIVFDDFMILFQQKW